MITGDPEQLHDARSEVEEPRRTSGAMQRAIAAQRILPRANLVLEVDPDHMSLWQAVRYVLSVPTNVALIVVSALGYFFRSGVRNFAVIFVGYQYSIGQGLATSARGALRRRGGWRSPLGRLADRLVERGHIAGLLIVAGGAFLLTSVLFLPPLLSRSLVIGVPSCSSPPPRCRRPIPRWTRRGWMSCRPACGGEPRGCARCFARSPKPSRRWCSGSSLTDWAQGPARLGSKRVSASTPTPAGCVTRS
jgi:hypothetical protein